MPTLGLSPRSSFHERSTARPMTGHNSLARRCVWMFRHVGMEVRSYKEIFCKVLCGIFRRIAYAVKVTDTSLVFVERLLYHQS